MQTNSAWSLAPRESGSDVYQIIDRINLFPAALPHVSLSADRISSRSFFFNPSWARRLNIHFGSGHYRLHMNDASFRIATLTCHSRSITSPPSLSRTALINASEMLYNHHAPLNGCVDGMDIQSLEEIQGTENIDFGLYGNVRHFSPQVPQSFCDYLVRAVEPVTQKLLTVTDDYMIGGGDIKELITFSNIEKINIKLGPHFFRPNSTTNGFVKMTLNASNAIHDRYSVELHSVFLIAADILDATGAFFHPSDFPLMKLCLNSPQGPSTGIRLSCFSSTNKLVFTDDEKEQKFVTDRELPEVKNTRENILWKAVSEQISREASSATFLLQGLRPGTYQVQLSSVNYPDQTLLSNILQFDIFEPLSLQPSHLLLMPGTMDMGNQPIKSNMHSAVFLPGGHSFELTVSGGPSGSKEVDDQRRSQSPLKFSIIDGPQDLIEFSAVNTRFPSITTKSRIGNAIIRVEVG